MKDDADHLNVNAIFDWARMVAVFTAEWMEVKRSDMQQTNMRTIQKNSSDL